MHWGKYFPHSLGKTLSLIGESKFPTMTGEFTFPTIYNDKTVKRRKKDNVDFLILSDIYS